MEATAPEKPHLQGAATDRGGCETRAAVIEVSRGMIVVLMIARVPSVNVNADYNVVSLLVSLIPVRTYVVLL